MVDGGSRGDKPHARLRRDVEEVASNVVDAALLLHRDLGPGLLESVYEAVLARMLEQRGLAVERQKPVAIHYQGIELNEGFRLDLLVDGQLIVELKSVENIHPVQPKQLLTYLRLMNLPLGLLINFGAPLLKDGLQRVVNRHTHFAPSRLRVHQENRHLHVTCAVIERDGLVMAARRSSAMSLPLKWEFPGGKIDRGESPEECLRREILEEMGVRLSVMKSLPASTHRYPTFTVTLYPFVCRIESGEITVREHSAIAWLPPDELKALDWAEADLPVIDSYLAERESYPE